MKNDGGSLDANIFGWHSVWLTLSAIIAISIQAALDAHSASTRVVVGLAKQGFKYYLDKGNFVKSWVRQIFPI